jgi:hypothetical protein
MTLHGAGGACGSDILFHEVCEGPGVATALFLALPEDRFQAAWVERGGPTWVKRYRQICTRLIPRVLQESETLPGWLADRSGYNVWERNKDDVPRSRDWR